MASASRYFDYNATAPTRPEVIEAMAAAIREGVGNPSSMHARGRRARTSTARGDRPGGHIPSA